MPPLPAARTLVGLLRRRERAWLAALVVVRVLTRVALVGVAVGFVRGGVAALLEAALVLALLLSVQGALASAVTRAARGALAARVVDRLLATDVLSAPPTESDEGLASTFESLYVAQQLVAEHTPGLVGDAVASLGIGAGFVVALRHAPTSSAVAAVAAVATGAAVLGVAFRATSRAASTAAGAYEPVLDDVVTAAGGRLELVASGRDADHRAALAGHLARWRTLSTRTDALLAIAGRAPVAAASLAVGAALWVGGSLRGSLGDLSLLDAPIAATAIPAFVGVVRNLLLVARDSVRVRPLIALLSAPDAATAGPAGAALPALPARIAWDRVSFSYPVEPTAGGTAFALRDVSLTWEPGAVLMLTGRNGSGKSTLLRLLLGLAKPGSGRIDVAGADLASLDLRAWRRSVAYLPQRPYLGDDATRVRDALRLTGEASDEAMRAALERVSLWEALARATPSDPLGARVRSLSAGQKQRLALARVLCRRAPVVVLDEPDANLDRAGIAMVGAIVGELRRDAMVVVAAHTEELVAIGDVRVTLEDGRVV